MSNFGTLRLYSDIKHTLKDAKENVAPPEVIQWLQSRLETLRPEVDTFREAVKRDLTEDAEHLKNVATEWSVCDGDGLKVRSDLTLRVNITLCDGTPEDDIRKVISELCNVDETLLRQFLVITGEASPSLIAKLRTFPQVKAVEIDGIKGTLT